VTGTNAATLTLTNRSSGTALASSFATTGIGLALNLPAAGGTFQVNNLKGGALQLDAGATAVNNSLLVMLTARDASSVAVTGTIQQDATGNLQVTPGGTNGSIALQPQGSGTVQVNSKRITSVADPTSAQDAATKNYVDLAVQGLDAKQSVKVATTAANSFTISGGAVVAIAGTTIDGLTLATNDRILIKDAPAATGPGSANSNQPGNGIYIVNTASPNILLSRATDMDDWGEVASAYVWVERGTANADTGWVVTSDQIGTINTTAMQWVKFSSAASSLVNKYSTLGSGTGTSFTITQATHGLSAARSLLVQILEEATGNVVVADVSVAASGDVTVTFATSQTLSNYRFTLIG
jgi:hypothetical protein